MTVEEFLIDPSTVQRVLSSLGDKVKLPNEGFLAGGSVANMLLSLYHENYPWKFEINDVDIFKTIDPSKIEDASMYDAEGENMLLGDSHLGMEMFGDDYGHVYIERDGTFYRVLNSERDGLINNISCYVSRGTNPGEMERFTPAPPIGNPNQNMMPVSQRLSYGEVTKALDNEIILRGFDLNCCQAGIDLDTKGLFYTQEFVDFLKSKQVMVNIPYTPLHTAIRLIKKLIMYKGFCYCNVEDELKFLSQAMRCTDEVAKVIGYDTYQKFLRFRHIMWNEMTDDCKMVTKSISLEKYFYVEPCPVMEMPYEYRKKYFPKTIKERSALDGLFDRYDSVPHPSPQDWETPEDKNLWKFKFSHGFPQIPESFNRIYELKRIWELKYRNKKKSHQRKIDMIFGNYRGGSPQATTLGFGNHKSFPIKCLMMNDNYYKCDFTLEHLTEIDSFFEEHRRLATLFSRIDTVQEQYQQLRMLKSLVNKEGDWVIGTLETLGYGNPDSYDEEPTKIEITKEWVQGLIDKEKERMGKPLCEPYNLENFKYKDCVRELISPLDLQKEGSMMGHCVGGYSNVIESGSSRIFHIEIDGVGSTLSLGIRKKNNNMWTLPTPLPPREVEYVNEFNINQHSGRYPEKGNKRPTNKNRGIAFKLAYFLAQEHLTDEEKKKIDDSIELDKKTREPKHRILEMERRRQPYQSHHASRDNMWVRWMTDGNSTKRRRVANDLPI